MDYQRIGVASAFSPTFAAVLAEADHFARQCGGELEVLHAARHDAEKEARFHAALGRPAPIRWLEGETPARALLGASHDFELLIAGALHRDDGNVPYTNSVARELLRNAECDLLLVPRPLEKPASLGHVVFALEPGQDVGDLTLRLAGILRPAKITLVAAETPFAAAIAASRGQEAPDIDEWLDGEGERLQPLCDSVETRVVRSNTGYPLCDVIQVLDADLLVVATLDTEMGPVLPAHVDWLYRIIPTRLLVVRA